MARKSQSIKLNAPLPPAGHVPALRLLGNGAGGTNGEHTGVSFEDGAIKVEHPDGSATINFNSNMPDETEADDKDFYKNLAKRMDEAELQEIANDLLEGVRRDEESRKEWLDTRALGMALLGAKLERPKTDTGLSGAPLEGMSTVRHPLLMEATVSFQATARAELLPAAGPVKVRNDAPPPPMEPGQDGDPGTSAAQAISDSLASTDLLGQALEKDMNHYLTSTATEYVPDTDRMLFYIGFGGDGFKKVYSCPIRNRPVSESIDAEDLIISNHCTDMHNSGRITHRIRMKESTLKRMQILGVYRDCKLRKPGAATPVDPAMQKKEEIEGVNTRNTRPQDMDYEIYEIYCELDLDEYAPRKFKGKGLPLPYRVTVEAESREVLDLCRNWKEDDEQALARRFFVQFPFIRGLGFYGFGFIHLLGNTTSALTAAWREFLDAGMFSCFPGFLYAKGVGRQNTNQFRVPPGGGIGLDIGAQQSIKDAIMPLPYKEPGAGFVNFITHVEDVGRRLAATGNTQVGEGKQDAPVGTTLALIEQASKVMDSAHKRLHAAQAEEFALLKERFKEDPEAFWRHNKSPTVQWKKDQFLDALNNYELIPVADPNNPTSLHRIAKAMAIKTLQQAAPDLYDPQAVDMRIMKIVDIDPQGLFRATPAAPPPDPRMMAVQAKDKAEMMKNQVAQQELQIKMAESQSRERIEKMKVQLELMRVKQEEIIHAHDIQNERESAQNEMMMDQQRHHMELHQDAQQHQQEMQQKVAEHQMDMQLKQHEVQAGMQEAQLKVGGAIHEMEAKKHLAERAADLKLEGAQKQQEAKSKMADESHEQKMRHADESNKAKIQTAKELAKVKKPAAKKYAQGGAVMPDPPFPGPYYGPPPSDNATLTETKKLAQAVNMLLELQRETLRQQSAPKRVIRDKNGRIIGVEIQSAPDGDNIIHDDGSVTIDLDK